MNILPQGRQTPESLTSLGDFTEMESTAMLDQQTVLVGDDTVQVNEVPGIKNWKTILINGAVVVAVALAGWLVSVDWSQYVSASWAVIIMAVGNIILRFFASGPAMSNVSVKIK